MRRYFVLGPLALVAIWLIVTHTGLVDVLFLPRPETVCVALWRLIVTGSVLPDIWSTVVRWLGGLLGGILIGIPLGVGMGSQPKIYASLELVVDFFRSVPTITLFPLFLVFFGIGNQAKIYIAAWATLLYVVINTLYGVRHVREGRLKVAQVLRATKWQVLTKVIIPDALPSIFVGIRIALSMSLVVVVASEMIMGGTTGLGRRIFDAAMVYKTPDMYAAILITGILGYISNKLFATAEQRIVHWASQ